MTDWPSSTQLVRSKEFLAACAALGSQACPTLDFAGLFVEFADPHFFLDAAALDELPKAADGLLGRLFITQSQLNHILSWKLGDNPPPVAVSDSADYIGFAVFGVEPAILATNGESCLQCQSVSTGQQHDINIARPFRPGRRAETARLYSVAGRTIARTVKACPHGLPNWLGGPRLAIGA